MMLDHRRWVEQRELDQGGQFLHIRSVYRRVYVKKDGSEWVQHQGKLVVLNKRTERLHTRHLYYYVIEP